MNEGQENFNCGNNIENFDENYFIKNYKKFNYFDFQGTIGHQHLFTKIHG